MTSCRQAPSRATPAILRTRRNAPDRRRSLATIGDAGGQAEIAVAQRPEGIRAAAGSALSGRALICFRLTGIRCAACRPGCTVAWAAPARPCALIRSPGATVAGRPRIGAGALRAGCQLRRTSRRRRWRLQCGRPSPGMVHADRDIFSFAGLACFWFSFAGLACFWLVRPPSAGEGRIWERGQ